MNHHVVIWDPKDDFWEGALVDAMRVNELRGRGVQTLPCVPELFRIAGVGGFMKRAWGAGWPLESAVPQNVCPLTLHTLGDPYRVLHWTARLMPSAQALANVSAGKAPAQGIMRITADAGRGTGHRGVVADDPVNGGNAVDFSKLGKPDECGGWTVYGRAHLFASGEGYVGLSLYGFGPGMRIAWAAATVTP